MDMIKICTNNARNLEERFSDLFTTANHNKGKCIYDSEKEKKNVYDFYDNIHFYFLKSVSQCRQCTENTFFAQRTDDTRFFY